MSGLGWLRGVVAAAAMVVMAAAGVPPRGDEPARALGEKEDALLAPARCEAIAEPIIVRFPHFLSDPPPANEAADKRLLASPDHLLSPTEKHDAAMLLLSETPAEPVLANTRRGCRLLQMAAGAKLFEAYAPLGQIYMMAARTPAELDDAGLAYQRGAREGDLIALMFDHELDGRRATEAKARAAAAASLRELAGRGLVLANLPLARAALEGWEGPPDAREASRLMEVAARADSAEAANELGSLLLQGGPNLAPDPAEAERWFARANELGSVIAAVNAGRAARSERRADPSAERAMQWFEAAAKAGSLSAKAEMARMLVLVLPEQSRDPARACALAREAADGGNRTGLHAYAQLKLEGLGCAKDVAGAMAYLKRASDAGNLESMVMLGHAMVLGEGVPKDEAGGKALVERAMPELSWAICVRGQIEVLVEEDAAYTRALPWLIEGSRRGYMDCVVLLSVAIFRGLVDGASEADAVELLKRAADAGHADAQSRYGQQLLFGTAVARDEAEARRQFEAAAAQKHPGGFAGLGILKVNGRGGFSADQAAAIQDFERAVALGGENSDALYHLGRMKLEGLGTPIDLAGGVALLRRAVTANNPNAAYGLAQLRTRGIDVPGTPDDSEAFAMLNRFGAEDDGCMSLLGDFHRLGRGTPVDAAKALDWYRRAAEAGSIQGANNYGFSLLTGIGGPRNVIEAAKWLKIAADGGFPNALMSMASLHLSTALGAPDPVAALADVTLAVALNEGDMLDDARLANATRLRDGLRARLSAEQVREADRRAAMKMRVIGEKGIDY